MRTPFLALALLVGLLAIPALPAGPAGFDGTVQAMTLDAQQPDPPLPPTQIDVDITDTDGAWYTNPVWLALGAIALIVLVLLIVSASRGGGTTVVKD
jgi:hypothetical protein